MSIAKDFGIGRSTFYRTVSEKMRPCVPLKKTNLLEGRGLEKGAGRLSHHSIPRPSPLPAARTVSTMVPKALMMARPR